MAYSPEVWTNFFIAGAGAAAALAGLAIVAISINVQQILAYSSLPSRAGAGIAMLVMVLVDCVAGLMPGQSSRALGWEITAAALAGLVLQVRAGVAAFRQIPKRPRSEVISGQSIGYLQALPMLAGGISLVLGRGGGLYLVGAGTLSVFVFSTIATWILLVEILR